MQINTWFLCQKNWVFTNLTTLRRWQYLFIAWQCKSSPDMPSLRESKFLKEGHFRISRRRVLNRFQILDDTPSLRYQRHEPEALIRDMSKQLSPSWNSKIRGFGGGPLDRRSRARWVYSVGRAFPLAVDWLPSVPWDGWPEQVVGWAKYMYM